MRLAEPWPFDVADKEAHLAQVFGWTASKMGETRSEVTWWSSTSIIQYRCTVIRVLDTQLHRPGGIHDLTKPLESPGWSLNLFPGLGPKVD